LSCQHYCGICTATTATHWHDTPISLPLLPMYLLALDTSSLAVLANADANVVTVALGINDADANTIVPCSSATVATQRHHCNLQPPPKATSQCRHASAIFQRHHCTTAIFQRSAHVDCFVLIFFFLMPERT
jgi:hypothetical protein